MVDILGISHGHCTLRLNKPLQCTCTISQFIWLPCLAKRVSWSEPISTDAKICCLFLTDGSLAVLRLKDAKTHRYSQRLGQNTEALHRIKPDEIPAWRESGHQVPCLTKELFVIYTCWERGNRFSPTECSEKHQQRSRAGLLARKSRPTQKRLVLVGCLFWLDLVFSLSFGFCLFYFLFYFALRSRELERT